MNSTEIFKIAGAIILSFGGASVVLFALSSWLGKIWANRLMSKEKAQYDKELAELKSRLQEQLEKGIHIYKFQFEKEYQIYEEIWQKLNNLKQATLALRPIVDVRTEGESQEEKKNKRTKFVGDKLIEFMIAMDEHAPFYAKEIYAKLKELTNICYKEAIQYQYGDEKDRDYWDKASKNIETILRLIDETETTIRDRISNVSIK